ncbi:MAG: hypothetical protein GPJ52_04960 [Candidatus Heimdallarchaeota archaeon]|nr:hypothetical protein [Candidatus Heimdallarchaeota archaeon]
MLSLATEEGPFFQASDAVKAVRWKLGSENRNAKRVRFNYDTLQQCSVEISVLEVLKRLIVAEASSNCLR